MAAGACTSGERYAHGLLNLGLGWVRRAPTGTGGVDRFDHLPATHRRRPGGGRKRLAIWAYVDDNAEVTSADRPGESVPNRWTASTVYADMWVDPDDDPRDSGDELADERSTLNEYLRAYRLTLQMKCSDLDASQLASRSVPPSTMSLLGLIRHMAEVERHWFRRVMAGQDAPKMYCNDDDGDGDWNGAVADPGCCRRGVERVAGRDRRRRADRRRVKRSWHPRSKQGRQHSSVARSARSHDRGIRPALRTCRPSPRADRRPRRSITSLLRLHRRHQAQQTCGRHGRHPRRWRLFGGGLKRRNLQLRRRPVPG